MSAGSFRQDGLGWRINLIRRRFGEWLEYKTSQFDPGWDVDWDRFKLLWQIIRLVLWSIVALLLVWSLWQLWLLLRPYWKRWRRGDRYTAVSLPKTPHLTVSDWVERSQLARIDANYHQAIICLYQAMLKLLDERDIIPTQLNLTDEEYRRSLLDTQISYRQPYELLLLTHQLLCFSRVEADRSLFEECQQAYQQIAD